jgi:PhnB protein
MAVSPFPDGYHRVTPYLVVQGAAQAIEFYAKHFGASEMMRMTAPDGKVAHAELKLGDAVVMIADEVHGFRGPKAFGGSPVSLLLYVEDVDAVVDAAVKGGSTLVRPVEDQFYGDRSGTLTDPFGHTWTVATHTEDVAPDELERRMAAMRG